MTDIPLPDGYYESVKGINWISGWACKRLLENGPTAKYYMQIAKKPSIIYDVAYSEEETITIGAAVFTGMHLSSMTEIGVGVLAPNVAASLYYIVQKHYPKPEISKIYKIKIKYTQGKDKSLDEWCLNVKGRLYRTPDEKIAWYKEWKACGN
jgi:hypothetical protein